MMPTDRKENTLRKLERMNKALRHEEPDRVPISDFFWGGFIERWRRELGLPADAPRYHYDLDWIVTTPNMDPWIRPFETLRETPDEVVVKTGFGAIMHKRFDFPMPEMRAWEIDTFEKLERAEFDDPARPPALLRRRRQPDRRRRRRLPAQLAAVDRDGQVACARISRSTAASSRRSECLTRLIGQKNAMLWMGEDPERMGAVINRDRRSSICDMAKAEIEAAAGLLDGFVIWGDVAYKKSTFMSPGLLARVLQAVGGEAWSTRPTPHGLPVIYHGCGNVKAIFAGLHRDRRRRLQSARSQGRAWTSSICAAATATASASAATATSRSGRRATATAIRREVLRKLNAAQRRRLHLPVRPFGHQRRVGPRPTTTSSSWSASTAATRCHSASMPLTSEPARSARLEVQSLKLLFRGLSRPSRTPRPPQIQRPPSAR